jgi:hypothetical protein
VRVDTVYLQLRVNCMSTVNTKVKDAAYRIEHWFFIFHLIRVCLNLVPGIKGGTLPEGV